MGSENQISETQHQRRVAGRVLRFVFDNQKRQQHRLDHLHLLDVLNELHFDLSENLLVMLLQDLGERGYLKFEENKDKDGVVSILKIQITPAGRDIVRGLKKDEAVRIE